MALIAHICASASGSWKRTWPRIASTPAGRHPRTLRSRSRHHARNANPAGASPVDKPGRRDVTRSLVDHPDQCGIIPLTGTCAYGRCGTGIAATVLAERRQVVEVVIQRKVIEYRIVGGTGACGRAQRSTFPAGIEAPVQWTGRIGLCGLHDPISVVALPAHRRGVQ